MGRISRARHSERAHARRRDSRCARARSHMLRALTNGTRYAPHRRPSDDTVRWPMRPRSTLEGGSPDDRSRQELGLVEREPGWEPGEPGEPGQSGEPGEPGWNEWIVGPIRVAERPAIGLVEPAGPVGLIVAARRSVH